MRNRENEGKVKEREEKRRGESKDADIKAADSLISSPLESC